MANARRILSESILLLGCYVVVFCATNAAAQNAMDACRLASVIPLSTSAEPAAKIVIDPPLPDPLSSRGVAIIQYCAQNLHFAPVFGPGALAVSPRVGHIHVRVDQAKWVWADASGNPIILQGLPPGAHEVTIELVNANHQPLDKGTVKFVVPEKITAEKHE